MFLPNILLFFTHLLPLSTNFTANLSYLDGGSLLEQLRSSVVCKEHECSQRLFRSVRVFLLLFLLLLLGRFLFLGFYESGLTFELLEELGHLSEVIGSFLEDFC